MFKNIKKYFLISLGTCLILLSLVLTLTTSFNFGIIGGIFLGVSYFLYGLFNHKINIKIQKNLFLKTIRFIYIIGNITMLLLTLFIGAYGQIDTASYKEDVLIVLGAGIQGEKITWPLYLRLEKSIEYYNKNKDIIIVVSGGQGFGEDIPESLAMKRYLISKGIPKYNIIEESLSTSTYENFKNSKVILDKHFKKDYNVAFITNDFHIFRASQLSKIVGLNSNHIHSSLQWYLIPNTYIRECMAIIKLLLLNK